MDIKKKKKLLSLIRQYKSSKNLLKQGDNDILTVQDGIKGIMFKGLKILNNFKMFKQNNIKFRIAPYNKGYQYELSSKNAINSLQKKYFDLLDFSDNRTKKDGLSYLNTLIRAIDSFQFTTIEPGSFFQNKLDNNDSAWIQCYFGSDSPYFTIKSSKQIRKTIKLIQKKLIDNIDKSLKSIEKNIKNIEDLIK